MTKEEMTYDDYLKGIKENLVDLMHVPEEHKTYELCLEAMKAGYFIFHVPEEHRTYEMCLKYLEND